MSTDDTINITRSEVSDDRRCLLVGQKSRQHFDSHGKAGKAIAKRRAMLSGKQCGGGEYSDLLAPLNCFKGSTDSNLSFAEPDVTTDESIHRNLALHVGLHINDRSSLVGGLDKPECVFHFRLPRCVGSKGMPRCVHALLVENNKFLGDLLHRRPHP